MSATTNMEDEYDEYNYDQDKLVNSGHSGKNRSKKEASEHTNHFDPSGHSRKLSVKLQNTETNRKEENLKPHPTTRK
ncbi:nuclear protein 1 [Aphis craccivora]|uniref:Nuclear protein 1 n=1 Tax=Aphis craccivora TaxID=307492 RepID=A0A6G0ZRC0_APHCR|nr:nuclear protein 1 [Aphis craccivora]